VKATARPGGALPGGWAPPASRRPLLCRLGFHRLRWEREQLHYSGLFWYWGLRCQRCQALLCFTEKPSRRLGRFKDSFRS